MSVTENVRVPFSNEAFAGRMALASLLVMAIVSDVMALLSAPKKGRISRRLFNLFSSPVSTKNGAFATRRCSLKLYLVPMGSE